MTAANPHDPLLPIYRQGDLAMLVALALYAIASVPTLLLMQRPGLSLEAELAWLVGLSLPGAIGFAALRGTLTSRLSCSRCTTWRSTACRRPAGACTA
ncbi:MAG: hypothetical protein P3W97_006195 [Tepidimonas sp.]|uniref:hypothetical protein n=1 Tax=Tepidimonas sp. TaxID=2002775 RepID=UPI00259D71D2|nr:hypothetical protein [Tepidimonas sp.]MDM7456838.1 hypothetical protein [Tepidimonas sp.]